MGCGEWLLHGARQAAVAERRQELFVLFRAVARVAPAEAYAVVGARLQRALGSPSASFQARPQPSEGLAEEGSG